MQNSVFEPLVIMHFEFEKGTVLPFIQNIFSFATKYHTKEKLIGKMWDQR